MNKIKDFILKIILSVMVSQFINCGSTSEKKEPDHKGRAILKKSDSSINGTYYIGVSEGDSTYLVFASSDSLLYNIGDHLQIYLENNKDAPIIYDLAFRQYLYNKLKIPIGGTIDQRCITDNKRYHSKEVRPRMVKEIIVEGK